MRTFVISDLHLGNGGVYDAFAGASELLTFLDRYTQVPTRVFINGDSIDFLMNEDPLQLDQARAVQQAWAIVQNPVTAGVMQALGRVLMRGGEVVIRLGNHDLELSLPEVQAVIRGALDQPTHIALRLQFQLGVAPEILDVGGARILITHGEHGDKWNRVEYDQLQHPKTYRYTPGSTLVKQLLNPLTRQYGLRFVNFLKPDFSGGTLAAFAVNPGIVKGLFKTATVDIIGQLLARIGMVAAFADDEDDVGIAARLADAELSDEEKQELEALLDDGPAAFADDGMISTLQIKLARAGLKLYSQFQRYHAVREESEKFLQLEPDQNEWKDALRLAKKEQVGAVIYGHTHAARWKEAEGIVYANTGTWIWLMQLPPASADADTWADFLTELKENSRLDPARQDKARTISRFTAALLEPSSEGGADMSLVEWKDGQLVTLGHTHVPAAARI